MPGAKDPEAHLILVTMRYEDASEELKALTEERTRAVRAARKAGITQKRVMEITGLSRQRVNQIVRGEDFRSAHRQRESARRKKSRAAD